MIINVDSDFGDCKEGFTKPNFEEIWGIGLRRMRGIIE
jgi:hypothetical protein